MVASSVADPDPGSSAFLTPGSGIRNRSFPDPGSQTHIFDNFWGKKFYNSLKIDTHFFLQTSKNKIIYNFVNFAAIKKVLTTHFFSPLSFVTVFGSGIRDTGSGMGKNQDPGSGINIPDPQHWSQEFQCCGSGSGIRDWVLFDPWIRDPGSGIGFFWIPDPGSRIPDPKTIFLRAF
jgi:hypothetical protein